MWFPPWGPWVGCLAVGSGRVGVVQKDSAATSQRWPCALPREVLVLLTAVLKEQGTALEAGFAR